MLLLLLYYIPFKVRRRTFPEEGQTVTIIYRVRSRWLINCRSSENSNFGHVTSKMLNVDIKKNGELLDALGWRNARGNTGREEDHTHDERNYQRT